jgi:hypothetical protein
VMCDALGGGDNEYWVHVADGDHTEVHLDRASQIKGYCLVVWRLGHVAEPTDLEPGAAGGYWSEVLRARSGRDRRIRSGQGQLLHAREHGPAPAHARCPSLPVGSGARRTAVLEPGGRSTGLRRGGAQGAGRSAPRRRTRIVTSTITATSLARGLHRLPTTGGDGWARHGPRSLPEGGEQVALAFC